MSLHLQRPLPLLPHDAETISDYLAVSREGQQLVFYNASGPIYTCALEDEASVRLAAVVLSNPKLGLATPTQIATAVGRHRSRVHDYRKRHRDGGTKALIPKRRGPKGPSKLKGTVLARAQKFLNQGHSNRQVAKRVGVSEQTIRKGIREGRLHRPQPKKEPVPEPEPASEKTCSTPRTRSDEDAASKGGVATKRDYERALAPLGLLLEAEPQFVQAESVAKAGVLLALPALLEQGLVEVGQSVYGNLKKGYYGLTSMLLTFAMMALLRIKSIEGLSSHSPGEFGLVLGLDRAPEMKTARRKLAELAGRGQALEFSRAFTERWAAEAPDALGYLYIDGHVRPYHGRKHRLPKTHVQRRRLCMPATTDYWVNDANAEPLMFVTAPANEGLLAMMERELLPQIRKLAGDRRVTLIFDREGWSPKRFRKWTKLGFDVLTYRKGKYEEWQRRCFKEVTVELHGTKVSYLLAERMLRLAPGFRMREVRRLCDDGHQTAVVTTRRDLPMRTVALRMFSRWQQENFFRYMRHEFALDHLPTTQVEAADPERSVPNPALKVKRQELDRVQSELRKVEQAYGQKAHDNSEQQRRTMRGFKISHAALGRKIKQLRAERDQLKAELKALPARVPVRQTLDGEPVVQLERERKVITDAIKMVAYRAETQLSNLVGPLLAHRGDEARKFVRQAMDLPADLLPNSEQGTLTVRLHTMATPRDNRALAALCTVLTELNACYPGTRLRLVFQATETPTAS